MLVDGKWTEDWQPVQATDAKGGFVRQTSGFRNWITPDGSAGPTGEGGFRAEAGRYHLYVALICPWASRTLIARKLKGLEDAVSVSVVEPELGDQGWLFATPDPVNGAEFLHQIYTKADPHANGRATVPVLWDKKTGRMVNNESAEIVRMFNSGFGDLASGPDLYPEPLRARIDTLNARVYPRLNDGVYRAGFATTQLAYEDAFRDVFAELDTLEAGLSTAGPFLTGESFTEADIRLFVTLVRFDAAYHGLFKTNLRRLADYKALSAYLARVLALPGVRETVSIEHIKRGYYSIRTLNPSGIVPVGPDLPGLDPVAERLKGGGVMAISLVIFLHGVGSRGADLAALAPLLQPALPGVAFEAPDAPAPFDMGGPGRQWFSVAGVTEANRAARIAAARPAFDVVIGDLAARHGLSDQPEKLAFVGFSQGTIMALDAWASGRWRPGAIIGFSGRLATAEPLGPAPGTRVLLVHGLGDATIPAVESEHAQQRLAEAGGDVTLRLLPGLGHAISKQGLDLAARHLSAG